MKNDIEIGIITAQAELKPLALRLEQQCVSLELAKRLKELGVKQESYFYWEDDLDGGYLLVGDKVNGDYAAFTVAELGEMLPKLMISQYWNNGFWYCYPDDTEGVEQMQNKSDTEADARAKCLIYLLENNLIPKKE